MRTRTTPPSEDFALPLSERIGFGLGSLATTTFATVPGLVLLYYMTDVLGITAALAAFVVFLPKLLDLIYNPIVGRLSDLTTSRLGPRRPWMIAGAIGFPLGFAAIFFSPFEGAAAAWWVAGALAVTGAAFSAFIVPYSTLPAELGASSAERTSMVAWRMGFLGLTILAAGSLAPVLVETFGGGSDGYRGMGVIMAGVILLGTLAALYGARRSTRAASTRFASGPGTLREAIRAARNNRQFKILIIVFMLLEIVMSITLAGFPYIAEYVIGDAEAVSIFFICVIAPMLVAMPLWRHAAVAYGNKASLVAAALFYAAGVLGVLLLPAMDESARFAIACATFVIAGIGFGGVQLLPQAMLADTLATDASDSDQRRAGLLAGLWSAAETVSSAFGAAIFGFGLAATGFLSSANGESVGQPENIEWGIVAVFTGGTVLSIIVALTFLSRFSSGSVPRTSQDRTGDEIPAENVPIA